MRTIASMLPSVPDMVRTIVIVILLKREKQKLEETPGQIPPSSQQKILQCNAAD